MNPLAVTAFALCLVALATGLGLLLKSRNGRVRSARADAMRTGDTRPGRSGAHVISAHELPDAAPLGSRATLLQFSTEFCAPCRATHGLLQSAAAERPGVAHLDVDLTRRPDLAGRFNILQTPTTFLLDGAGAIRARIGGAPRSAELFARLDELIGANLTKGDHVNAPS